LTFPLVYSDLDRRITDQQNDPSLWPYWHVDRSETGPPSSVPDVNEVFDNLGYAYAFFSAEHQREGFNEDAPDAPLLAKVRWCPLPASRICNFNCPCPNAQYSCGYLYFGDGWTADDVVAHEFTHGVTDNSSQLFNVNQSGAIGESLSDVWGEFVDLTVGVGGNDTPAVRWLHGEDLPNGPSRYMKNPPKWEADLNGDGDTTDSGESIVFDHPDRMGSQFFNAGPDDEDNDFGGVHQNAGVNNKLAYLLTDGGTFNGRTITGLGISRVADLYYECQIHLLTSASDYTALYYALTQAAVNLGFTQEERANIEQASRAVEIRPEVSVTLKTPTSPGLMKFTSAGDAWMFGGRIVPLTTESPNNTLITPNPAVAEFIVKDEQGTVLALLDSGTGNLYLKGKLYENISSVWQIPSHSLLIKNSDGVVAFITSAPWMAGLVERQFPFIVPPGSLVLYGAEIRSGWN
jgi:hypothetical protein